ncbi:hypothetical protein GYMLUDRAFT_46810 [Collybiopsis luxurians FD-317 M1]|uniref:FAD dependent oxidoreductase domain-containing protein n=1 Tax=Collybiopsis luxurians FD-317 M1 TaxID=944289 RepID=A0A0D0B1F0_9AGAR|nr:hypothetical protein GYMLUDRAFT_46810 [Collybiopsis luxurians FD-317 M1]
MPPGVAVIGSGVTGLSVALALSRIYNVTVVARDLVGDNESHGWASPWAGAFWRPHLTSSNEDIEIQKASFRYMWKLAESDPDCGVRVRFTVQRIISIDYFDQDTDEDQVWYKDFIPGCKQIPTSDLPKDVTLGYEYQTVVIVPLIYLQWLKDRLTASGVTFIRKELGHISQIRDIVPNINVVVNATGVGAKYLGGVEDEMVEEARGQTIQVRTKETTVICRSGNVYAYSIPRLDGTAIIGGISQPGNTSTELDPSLRADILRRARLITAPGTYPDKVEDLDIVDEFVGIRPGRKGGVRVEKQVLAINTDSVRETGRGAGKMNIVHAYGVGGTGYKYSAGLAKRVAELVDEFIYGEDVPL